VKCCEYGPRWIRWTQNGWIGSYSNPLIRSNFPVVSWTHFLSKIWLTHLHWKWLQSSFWYFFDTHKLQFHFQFKIICYYFWGGLVGGPAASSQTVGSLLRPPWKATAIKRIWAFHFFFVCVCVGGGGSCNLDLKKLSYKL
jgi:hypothetical protein